MSGPRCRYCGKRIAKRTVIAYFGGSDLPVQPTTIAEAQRYCKEPIIATRRGYNHITRTRYIWTAYTWDGKSYKDEFFCKGQCAERFGRLMAREGKCTNKYNEAMAADQVAATKETTE